jgi:hypothetical protein
MFGRSNLLDRCGHQAFRELNRHDRHRPKRIRAFVQGPGDSTDPKVHPFGIILTMANGAKGDHPLNDILYWKKRVFSSRVDALITEIANLGGQKELERTFDLFQPPPLPQFEAALQEMRDRLWKYAKEGAWEV